MNDVINLKEFDSIVVRPKGSKEFCSKDGKYKYLDKESFDLLVQFIEENHASDDNADAMDFFTICRSKDRSVGQIIKVKNYVGLIQLKNGYQIEILPKIDLSNGKNTREKDNIEETKKIFLRMLLSLKDFSGKISNHANLNACKMNIYEIFINMYLEQTKALVKQGLKSSYTEQEDNLKFFKGKLNINEHIKYNFAHKERFYVSYDEFMPNRAENKLIKATLLKLKKITSSAQNSKEIYQLLGYFDNIDVSTNFDNDFSKTSIDRSTKLYEPLMRWSKVFLYNKSFTNFSGSTVSYSLLFPMEKIFESYVAQQIKQILSPRGWDISIQDKEYHLFYKHVKDSKQSTSGYPVFSLRPDIVIRSNNNESNNTITVVLDTKWKRLNKNNSNYNISQGDMYQMYAYSKKCNCSYVWLLYPKTEDMNMEVMDVFFKSKDGSKDGTILQVFFVDLAGETNLGKLADSLEKPLMLH